MDHYRWSDSKPRSWFDMLTKLVLQYSLSLWSTEDTFQMDVNIYLKEIVHEIVVRAIMEFVCVHFPAYSVRTYVHVAKSA